MTGHSPGRDGPRGDHRPDGTGASRRCCRATTPSGGRRADRERFGLPHWQFTLSATDANRFASGSPARSPDGRRSSSTTTATTAPSTRRSRCSTRRRRRRARARQRRAAGRSRGRPAGRRVQRPRARSSASSPHGDVACRPHRAGADQHRDRPARARLPRGAARAHPPARHAADHRRDPHVLAPGQAAAPRAWDLDPDVLAMGKPIGGGIPTGAYGVTRRRRRPGARARRSGTPPTSAASAARSPATRSRSPPCGPRSARSSPRRPTSGWSTSPSATRRRRRGDRAARAALDAAGSAAGSEYMFRRSPAQRRRGRPRSPTRRARQAHAPLHAQPGHPLHPVPHDGADLPGDDRRAGRSHTEAFDRIAAELTGG